MDIWDSADPKAASAIEARVDAVEKNLSKMRDRVNELEQELMQRLQQQTDAVMQERQERAKQDKKIRDKLEVAQAGGLHISMAGVVCLAIGVIMSTIPRELAYLSNSLFP